MRLKFDIGSPSLGIKNPDRKMFEIISELLGDGFFVENLLIKEAGILIEFKLDSLSSCGAKINFGQGEGIYYSLFNDEILPFDWLEWESKAAFLKKWAEVNSILPKIVDQELSESSRKTLPNQGGDIRRVS